jgi:hypothetical protein
MSHCVMCIVAEQSTTTTDIMMTVRDWSQVKMDGDDPYDG